MISIKVEKRDLDKFGKYKEQFKHFKKAMRNPEKDIYELLVQDTDAMLKLCEEEKLHLSGFELRDVNYRVGRFSEVGSVKGEGCR